MCGCLKLCCCSQGGLRCHSVIGLCGFGYFMLMFALFDRQNPFFEFKISDTQGVKWACFISSIFFLAVFVLTMFLILKIQKAQKHEQKSNKISISEYKNKRMQQQKPETQRLIRQDQKYA